MASFHTCLTVHGPIQLFISLLLKSSMCVWPFIDVPWMDFFNIFKKIFFFPKSFCRKFQKTIGGRQKNSNQFFFFSVVYYYSWLIKMGFRVMEISRKEGRESRTRSFKIAEISLKSCRHNQSDQMARSFFQCLAIYNNEYLFAQ